MMERKEYQLDIYTWPAMTGAPCEIRTSRHDTPTQAIGHLEAQTKPYAYAVLSTRTPAGYGLCDWNGRLLAKGEQWPQRRGTNGRHPAEIAIRQDWLYLVHETRRRHTAGEGGTAIIADKLIQERHPMICGWAEKVGWAATLDIEVPDPDRVYPCHPYES